VVLTAGLIAWHASGVAMNQLRTGLCRDTVVLCVLVCVWNGDVVVEVCEFVGMVYMEWEWAMVGLIVLLMRRNCKLLRGHNG
jgi:hypothetical protein